MSDREEIQDLFLEHAPNVSIDIIDQQGLVDSLATPVVIAAEAAVVAFPFLWKIFLAWLDRYTNGKVTVKYKGDQDKEITVEYSKLSKNEVQKILQSAGDKAKPALVQIEFRRD